MQRLAGGFYHSTRPREWKRFCDPSRLRLLSVLAKQELCVCDLATIVDMSESAVSHQLRTLRTMRVVSYRKKGRKVFYSLDDNHILELYRTTAEHLSE